jgi:non-ribosomal peptide synthetase component F
MAGTLGLVRLEVIVPRTRVDAVRAYAVRLREATLARTRLDQLLDAAVRRFDARCFWNVDLSRRDPATRQLIVSRLRKHGGHAGWRLATDIEDLLRKAAAGD